MRACLRCIAKKRRCDHQQPTCSLCQKAREVCEYPPDQYRRGPIAGYVKRIEQRLEEVERALSFVLAQDGVRQVLSGPQYRSLDQIGRQNPVPAMSREERSEWYDDHVLDTVGDLLRYPLRLGQVVNASETPNPITITDTGNQILPRTMNPDLNPGRLQVQAPNVFNDSSVWAPIQDSTSAPVSSNQGQLSSWADNLPPTEFAQQTSSSIDGAVADVFPEFRLNALAAATAEEASAEEMTAQRQRAPPTSSYRQSDTNNTSWISRTNETDLFW